MARWLKISASVCGFTAVALGAIGAHALRGHLSAAVDAAQRMQWWETAAHYHLVHSVALLVIAWLDKTRPFACVVAGASFLAGIVLFSGSLYALALTGNLAFSSVTPLGGLCLLAGWGALLWASVAKQQRDV